MSEFEPNTQLDLLRHGECEGGQIFRGHTDVALSDEGEINMSNSCKAADTKWDIVISSPLVRCRRFAEQLCKESNVELLIDTRLREMSFGEWDGKLISEIYETEEDTIRSWMKNPVSTTPPDGEPLKNVWSRVSEFLEDLLVKQKGMKVLVVSHGGVMRVALSNLLGMKMENVNRFDVPYASLSRLVVYHSNGEDDWIKLLGHNVSDIKSTFYAGN